MRVVRIEDPGGGPEVLRMADRVLPEPPPGAVRVRVAVSGVNRADILQRLGRYPAPEGYPQDVPGLEFSGVVEAVGDGIPLGETGRRVMGIVGGGGYAEALVVDHDELISVPDSLDLVAAGGVPEAFMTAFDAIILQAGLARGETLLVHAVGSGVGTAALQLASRIGARVVGTSRTPEKLQRAEALAPLVKVLADDGWPDRIREETGGDGVDVILDLVGGPYLAGNQRVLAEGGRHVVVGIPGGARAEIDLARLMSRRVRMHGTVLRSRGPTERSALARAFAQQVLPGLESGELRPVLDRILPAASAAEAHRIMGANQNFGKIVLRW